MMATCDILSDLEDVDCDLGKRSLFLLTDFVRRLPATRA